MLKITMYGRPPCEDTDRSREYFKTHHIPFTEVNIDEDQAAEAFVRFINDGNSSTPTIILNRGDLKIILTEPSDEQLAKVLALQVAI